MVGILQLVAPFGFAAVLCTLVLLWNGREVRQSNKRNADRLLELEQRQSQKYDELERFVRTELMDLCRKQGETLERNTSALERFLNRCGQCLKDPT